MKQFLFSCAVLLFASAQAQFSVRVINLNLKFGAEEEMARLFEEYHKGPRNSGGAHFSSVNYLDNVTHRVIFAGDPANFGAKKIPTQAEQEAYMSKIYRLFDGKSSGSHVMTTLAWKGGDRDKNKFSKVWEFKASDPAKYLQAHTTFVKAIEEILGDRLVGLSSIDMGGSGGTHSVFMSGASLNDLVLTERALSNTKAFQTFIANRGAVEMVSVYMTKNILRFN